MTSTRNNTYLSEEIYIKIFISGRNLFHDETRLMPDKKYWRLRYEKFVLNKIVEQFSNTPITKETINLIFGKSGRRLRNELKKLYPNDFNNNAPVAPVIPLVAPVIPPVAPVIPPVAPVIPPVAPVIAQFSTSSSVPINDEGNNNNENRGDGGVGDGSFSSEQDRAAEAAERATSFLRDFNNDEQEIINAALWGLGLSTSIVAESGMDTVQRSSMRTLQPGMWLNDEIVHYFYLMLAKRDAELCSTTNTDPETTTTEKLRSHFFKSFFITKLLNEGSATNDGEYEYRNVKSWSQKVPGEDIFALDKIFVPINIGNMHWISAVIFMQKKRIEMFDSLGSNGKRYLEVLFQYLQDEHLDKKNTCLPDLEKWKLVQTQPETPRQNNGYDCGIFACFFADFLSIDLPLTFDQSHIDRIRERVALSIMKGKAIIWINTQIYHPYTYFWFVLIK